MEPSSSSFHRWLPNGARDASSGAERLFALDRRENSKKNSSARSLGAPTSMPLGPFRSEANYWPYERSSETDALDSNRSAQRLFVEALEREMLLSRPCAEFRYSAADRQLGRTVRSSRMRLEDIRASHPPRMRTQYVLGSMEVKDSRSQASAFQSHPLRGRRQPPFGRVSERSRWRPAARTTLEGPRRTLKLPRRKLVGKSFPNQNQAKPERPGCLPKWGNYLGDGVGDDLGD